MAGAAELFVNVGADISDVVSKLNDLSGRVDSLGSKMEKSGGKGGFLSNAFSFATGGLITKGIDAISGSIGGLASSMVGGNAQMEDFNTQFEVMTGSADNAKKLMGDLQQMGAKTPFEFTDLAAGTQTLLAFGRSQKDILPDLQMLGDISGGNKEKLNSLSLVYGQVASNGKMMGGDLLQMINAGFNPLNIISQKTGKSMSELRDEMSKGQISFEMVRDAMQTATSSGGQFYGMMDKQSGTFNGLMSTLQDNFSAAMRTLGQPIFDKLKEGLNWLIGFLSKPEVQAGIADFANKLANGIGIAADAIGKVITFLSPLVTYVQQFIATIQGGESPLQAFGDLIANVGNYIGPMVSNLLAAIGNALPGIISQLGQWAGAFLGWVGTDVIPFIAEKLGELGAAIGNWITGGGLSALVDNLVQWGGAFLGFVQKDVLPFIGQKLLELGTAIGNWVTGGGLSALIDNLVQWGGAFLGFIAKDVLPFIGQKLLDLGTAIWNWITGGGLTALISNLVQWGTAFVNWIAKDALPFIVPKLGEFAQKIWTWLTTEAVPTAITKLGELGAAFLGWVGKDVIPFIGAKLGEFAQKIWDWITQTATDAWTKVQTIGSQIIEGIKKGINDTWNNLVTWLSGLIKDNLPQFIKDWLGIKSPSRVFAEIGRNVVLGFAKGIDDTWSEVNATLSESLLGTKTLFSDMVSGEWKAGKGGWGDAGWGSEGWGGAVIGWGDTGTTSTGGMFGAFTKGLKDVADTATKVAAPAMQLLGKEFDPANTGGMMGMVTPALDPHSETSFEKMFNDSTNGIFRHTTEAWIPQMRTAFIGFFTQMTTWFTEYTALWVREWSKAMANMTTPPLPGGTPPGGTPPGGTPPVWTPPGGGGHPRPDRPGGGGGGSGDVYLDGQLVSYAINTRQRSVARVPSVVYVG